MMNTRTISILLAFLFTQIGLVAQETVAVEKGSPFTAVDWDIKEPKVKFEGEWYSFEKIDKVTKAQLLEFCQREYGLKWRKRFSEDIVEVLQHMGYKPMNQVSLLLKKDDQVGAYKGTMSRANRELVCEYNDQKRADLRKMVTGSLSQEEVEQDIAFLITLLEDYSAYQGLNGYDPIEVLEGYSREFTDDEVNVEDFGLFLTKILGRIGDRHSYVRNYSKPTKFVLPFVTAPLIDKVVALNADRSSGKYALYQPKFPYIKAIDGVGIHEFLMDAWPEEVLAPKSAYHSRASMQLPLIERIYQMKGMEMPATIAFTFTDGENDKVVDITPIERGADFTFWQDKFVALAKKDEELNDVEVAKEHYQMDKKKIGYIRIPDMVEPDEAPNFYAELHGFMSTAKNSKALIVDIRGNSGGQRHLIWELAGYFVHPDSAYIVNVAQQRAMLPLNNDWKGDLHNRYLYSLVDLGRPAQDLIRKFNNKFEPFYNLPADKFSLQHFSIFNGKKITAGKYYYNKPIYILIDERSFSAASVLATCFKDLPNITLVGTTTDGSSGNSEVFYLPNSHIRLKLSTMVSFQKNGKPLDGYGTEPDIKLERDLDQVLWKEDSQLRRLKEMIISNSTSKK